MILKILKISGLMLLGIIIMFFLNYYVIDPIIIPDPCKYHGEKTSSLFRLFYKIESSEGFHPIPTSFNFVLTAIIGAALGFISYRYFKKIYSN